MVEDNRKKPAPTVAERPGALAPAPAAGNAPSNAPSDPVGASSPEAQLSGAPLAPDTLVGKVIDGRYRILQPLAEGGMGSVFLAEQTGLRRKVALKVMVSADPELVERFQREATALAEVSHPAIVEIYDFTANAVEAGNRGCLCMAFIDGMDLADYLDTRPERRLEPDEVITLVIPVISALVELHANGIIHRDIKPANLVRFLRADGRPGVKLVDFGIARRQVDPGMTASGLVLGTPPYLPPEAFLGEKATPLMDIYALGATMFELLTGAPPFAAETQAKIIQRTLHEEPPFPPQLQGTPLADLIGRMLGKIARNRPDAMQVLKGLEAARRGKGSAEPATEAEAQDRDQNQDQDERPTRALKPVTSPPEDERRIRASFSMDDRRETGKTGLVAGLALLAAIEAAAIVYLLLGS